MKNFIPTIFMAAIFAFAVAPASAELAPANTAAQASHRDLGEMQHITELLKDGHEGYKLSADSVRNTSLKELFRRYAAQRTEFLNALKAEVAKQGGDPDKGGSALGAAHRGWMNIRKAVSTRDDKAIVDEVLRGEETALKEYQEALTRTIPAGTKTLLEKQRKEIQNAYDKVKSIDLAQDKQV